VVGGRLIPVRGIEVGVLVAGDERMDAWPDAL